MASRNLLASGPPSSRWASSMSSWPKQMRQDFPSKRRRPDHRIGNDRRLQCRKHYRSKAERTQRTVQSESGVRPRNLHSRTRNQPPMTASKAAPLTSESSIFTTLTAGSIACTRRPAPPPTRPAVTRSNFSPATEGSDHFRHTESTARAEPCFNSTAGPTIARDPTPA